MTDDLLTREFPDFDQATLPTIPDGFRCAAWHHDALPCWLEMPDRPCRIQLAIDYPDASDRECSGAKRFHIDLIAEDGTPWPYHDTDDWSEMETVIAFVRHVRDLGLGFHVDTRGRDYVGPGDFGRVFTDEQADQYDATIADMADITDPYEAAFRVWRAMGLMA